MILALQVISYGGLFAAISPYSKSIDFASPKGLSQIIQVTFQSKLDWIEEAIDFVLESVGKVIRYKVEEKPTTTIYMALVLFQNDFFESPQSVFLTRLNLGRTE